ncbi:MAG: hypothetical protein ACI810_000871 [Gammaproteobacteria bacterium]
MAKPSNKSSPAKKNAPKASAKVVSEKVSSAKATTAAKTTVQQSRADNALATKTMTKASAKKSKLGAKSRVPEGGSSKAVTDKATSTKATQSDTLSAKSPSHVVVTERKLIEKTNGGNGIAWLALLCGLGGLAAGGYAFYQSTLNQQGVGGIVTSMSTQLNTLSASQTQSVDVLDGVTARVDSIEMRVSDQFLSVETSFTENTALLEQLKAQISTVEGKEPMALLEQTQVLETRSQILQKQSLASINQLGAQVGQTVSKWQRQEFLSVLSSVERNLAWTDDTKRAVTNLKMLGTEINSLDSDDFAAVSSALAVDIAVLEAIEPVDVEATYQQLASLSSQVASLTFMQDTNFGAEQPKRESASDSSVGEQEDSTGDKLKAIGKSLLADIGSMVKVRTVGEAPMALLDANTKFMINEAIRLDLKSAQLALLKRNDAVFVAALQSALETSRLYLDQQSDNVTSWSNTFGGLSSLTLNNTANLTLKSKEAMDRVLSQSSPEVTEGEQ